MTVGNQPNQPTVQRVNVSMVSLKWADVLSTLLPGTVALFAISSWFPMLNERIRNLKSVGVTEGFGLLIGAALLGGVLEAFTRVVWERYWLIPHCRPADNLRNLNSANLDVYDRGVESSYKYTTFYANLAWAVIMLLISRTRDGKLCSFSSLIFAGVVALLLTASHIQWKYYVHFQNNILGGKADAEKPAATGDENKAS